MQPHNAVYSLQYWLLPAPRMAVLLVCWSLLVAPSIAGLRTPGHSHALIVANASADVDHTVAAISSSLEEGVRKCLHLKVGEEMEVSAAKQRYGTSTFLVARPRSMPAVTGQEGLQNTFEALLDGCRRPKVNLSAIGQDIAPVWLADVGSGDGALAGLALSLGCAVAAFDGDGVDARGLDMTRCLNEPRRPFAVFPAIPSDITKLNNTGNDPAGGYRDTAKLGGSIMMDNVFMRQTKEISTTVKGNNKFTIGPVAMLKVVLQQKNSNTSVLRALRGARDLLLSGRVRCLATEMNFDLNTSKELLNVFEHVEHAGYNFAHIGSLDYPHLEVSDDGSYVLFKTDVKQLRELFDSYVRIRHFDERSGRRAYSGSLSLDRKGKFFDYTDVIFACQGEFPKRLTVKEKGNIRFRNGVWWLEEKANNAANKTVKA